MFFIRPHLFEFLKEMTQYYEMMIFTASTKDYADMILNLIDPNKEYFMHRLYREHTTLIKFEVIKDLARINRDLRKVILIDNMPSNFKLQPDNGIHIKTWTNDIWDKQLVYLSKFLKQIAIDQVNDVKPLIKGLKERTINSSYEHEPNYQFSC
jgi:CTD small phosphatase-like protein 2